MKRKPDFKNGIFHGKPIYVLAVILLTVLLVISILTAVTIGSVDLSVKDVYSVILYKVFGIGDPEVYGVGAMSDIVWFIRLPRILLATAVGMGLAVAGVVMQAIVKNPIADPYILGISSGASLGATVAIFLGVGAVFGSNSIGICGRQRWNPDSYFLADGKSGRREMGKSGCDYSLRFYSNPVFLHPEPYSQYDAAWR